MAKSPARRRLSDTYRFTGFRALEQIKGVFGDPRARVVTLVRRSKKLRAMPVGECTPAGTTESSEEFAICLAAIPACTWSSRFGVSCVEAAPR
jgi:hypothetical protein